MTLKQNPLVAWVLNVFSAKALSAPQLPPSKKVERKENPTGSKLARQAFYGQLTIRHRGMMGKHQPSR